MRKRLKIKRRTCALCKPNKRGGAPRWKNRELAMLTEWERDRQGWLGR